VFIGGFFKVVGIMAFIVSMVFFYVLGGFHRRIKNSSLKGKTPADINTPAETKI
jgi:hypothetical protein